METWYTRLIKTLEISATSTVADYLRTAVGAGLFRNERSGTGIDISVSNDVICWFRETFNPWFAQLSSELGTATTKEELFSAEYSETVNRILTALWVSRSYYAMRSNGAIISTSEHVEIYKAKFCEEVANAVATAFESARLQFGDETGVKTTETLATAFNGSIPETFTWTSNVAVNHPSFEALQMKGGETKAQPQDPGTTPATKPATTIKKIINNQSLPWIIAAGAVGLALGAASRE